MINGLMLDRSNGITDVAALAHCTPPIDFMFLPARDGYKDNPDLKAIMAQVKGMQSASGEVLLCSYSMFAYGPTSPAPESQAASFISFVNPGGSTLYHLPPAIFLGFEVKATVNGVQQYYPIDGIQDKYIAGVTRMIDAVTRLIGRRPLLISTPNVLVYVLKKAIPPSWLECPLMIFDWRTSETPQIEPWTRFAFWNRRVTTASGVSGNVNLVIWPGDRGQLKTFAKDPGGPVPSFGTTPTPPPPPPPPADGGDPKPTDPSLAVWQLTMEARIETLETAFGDVHTTLQALLAAVKNVPNLK